MQSWKRPLTGIVQILVRRRVWMSAVVTSFLFSGYFISTWAQEVLAPSGEDRRIARTVSSMLEESHVSGKPLNDQVGERGFAAFIKDLDPRKVYFLQSDVDEFGKMQTTLDDMVRAGDVNFAFKVFARFLQRVDERTKWANEWLDKPHDFTADEVLSTDFDNARFCHNDEEAKELWRKWVKYDLLMLKTTEKLSEKDAIAKLHKRYNGRLKRYKNTSHDDLLEIFVSSMTSAFDPHTSYMSNATLENFRIAMRLNLDGIGATLSNDEEGYCVVAAIIPGGAADKDGRIKAKDKIVSVGEGEDGEMVEVIDARINDVVAKIRGKAGTVVRLGVIPDGKTEKQIMRIVRAKVELKDSEAHGEVMEVGAKPDGAPWRVGVIDVPSFYMDMEAAQSGNPNYKSVTRDVKKILDDFNAKKVDSVVLDLRRNGGGSLTEAISLTGLFIDRGSVVQVKDSDQRVRSHDDLDNGVAWDGPLTVIISKLSASASEILAGAVQDYGRGIVVGDTSTHGKGTVQTVLDVGEQILRIAPPPYGALKVTIQQFYRPGGDSTQLRGVLSDIVIPSMIEHIEGIAEGDLDYALAFDKVPAARFTKVNKVSTEILNKLKSDSKDRIAANEDFVKLNERIEKYTEQRKKKRIPLNEAAFLAQRAELDADKEDEKLFEDALGSSRGKAPAIRRDYYLEEVMAITNDYCRLLKESPPVAQRGEKRFEKTP
jgi:carboxyl-terminal processing protease